MTPWPGSSTARAVAGRAPEASAYARFRGEELPTLYHWQRAIAPGAFPWTLPASNLDGDALRPVGEGDAMSWVGAFDLLGNVPEWLVNARGEDRAVIGGSVNDDLYLAMQTNLAISPFDRSEFNGFRTMRTADDSAVMARARSCRCRPPSATSRASARRSPLKRHVVAPGGHFVPRDLLIRETLSWLDEHLGPVPRF